MMYHEKFVACIKVNGKVLREQNEIVHLPLGCEYTIYLKNLHTRKALVKIEIDNRVVISDLVINPNSSCNLERFVDGFSNSVGPRFKFIEKTQQISDFRGDRPEDGLLRIEYQFEQELPTIKKTIVEHHHTYTPYWYSPFTWENQSYGGVTNQFMNKSAGSSLLTRSIGNNNVGAMSADMCCAATTTASYSAFASNEPLISKAIDNVDGITVEGSNSTQKFTNAYIGTLEPNKHVIILKLYGTTSTNEEITSPITVETKIQCKICGMKSSSYMKFCGNCGAALL